MQADKIQALYPDADRVGLQSGHCPHDDTPDECNAALLDWLAKLEAKRQAPGGSGATAKAVI